jgi:hypothetical protein
MVDNGLTITPGEDMTRINASCEHHNGLIYIVPAERSWVCDSQRLPAHALAGFFNSLVGLQQPAVQQLMQQWGISFRQLPGRSDQADSDDQQSVPATS